MKRFSERGISAFIQASARRMLLAMELVEDLRIHSRCVTQRVDLGVQLNGTKDDGIAHELERSTCEALSGLKREQD